MKRNAWLLSLAALATPAISQTDAPPTDLSEAARDYPANVPTDQVPHGSESKTIVVTGRAANLIGIAASASEGQIGKVDLDDRPIQRVGELLEVIPGLIATQHSGGGKANQYFLRGFNLDHGTDFATFIDGMPINLRTHGHGQGYSDLNFIIPEFVQQIDYAKGPYRADVGDFGTAGSAKFHTIDTATPLVTAEVGTSDYYRVVGGGSSRLGVGNLFLGGEVRYDNGPFQIPGDLRLWNGLAKWTGPLGGGTLRATLQGFHVSFRSAEQVPQRAIDSGLIDRLGYIDPYLGGATTRVLASASWTGDGNNPLTALVYANYYKFKLISNFTYFLDDPVHGDEFEQRDSRFVVGGRIDKRLAFHFGMPVELVVGADTRADLIAPIGLYHTEFGQIRSVIRQDRVNEESVGAFAEATFHPLSTVRLILGLRGDAYAFDVRSNIAVNSGHSTAGIVSPKAAVAWTPIKALEFYANYGEGFHSNDGRGTALTVSPTDGTPREPVTALVKARGYEAGVRALPLYGLTLTGTYWWLDLKSELQFQGDAGETAPVGPSKRHGYELSAFYKPADWLTIDGQYSRSFARETDLPSGADRIPNALERVLSAGVVVKYGRASLGGRLRHFGAYPIIEDNSVRAAPLTVVNARLGYDFGPFQLAADLLNALNSKDNEIEYFYPSRLPGEPLDGVADRHVKPIEPRQLRLSATVRL